MRRLVNICLIERTVPKVVINRQNSASQAFGTLANKNRPEGFVQAMGLIYSNLRDGDA